MRGILKCGAPKAELRGPVVLKAPAVRIVWSIAQGSLQAQRQRWFLIIGLAGHRLEPVDDEARRKEGGNEQLLD